MEKITLKVSDQSEMDAFYLPAARDSNKTSPGLIILQEAFGVNSHIKDLVRRFSEAGYFAMAPELYHRTGRGFTCGYTEFQTTAMPHFSALKTVNMIEDVRACYDWLKNKQNISKVAVIGYCMGGRAAFLANSEITLNAAISFYGGRIFPEHLPLADKQKSPLLLGWGGLDSHIPPEHREAIAAELTKAKKDYVEVVFSQAQHGFACDERASFNPQASAQAWALTLQFLKDHLKH